MSLALILTSCGSKKTSIPGAQSGDLPNNGFPLPADAQTVQQTSDPLGDWGFYTGESPGRTDGYVDITKVWTGFTILDENGVRQLEQEVPCGPGEGSTVTYCPRPPRPFEPGSYLFISMQLAGPARQENTSPEDSGRYSLFFDLGNNPDTESTATADGPDLASAGADYIYQLVFGQPGGAPEGADPNAVELTALDYATDTFPETGARVWLHDDFATWLIPLVELPVHIDGVRAMAFWGDARDQGKAALGGHDVAPGGVHAPFGFLALQAPFPPGPSYDDYLQGVLQDAFRKANTSLLLDDLHPAVIQRYGEDQCSSYVEGLGDPTRRYRPLGSPKPGAWDYASDGHTTTIPDAVEIPVEVTIEGKTTETDVHLAPGPDGDPAWFTDCGTPVM